MEFLSRYARPVDENAVAAFQILDVIFAAFRDDPGVIAGCAVVPQDQVVVRLPADRKRNRRDRHAVAIPRRIDDDKR